MTATEVFTIQICAGIIGLAVACLVELHKELKQYRFKK